MQRLKLSREFVSSSLKDAIPEYEEMLAFIEKNGGWISLPPKMLDLVDRLKLHNYPELYRSNEIFSKMLLLSVMSVEEANALGVEFAQVPEKDRARYVEELLHNMGETSNAIIDSIPDTPEEEEDAKKAFGELSPEKQAEAIKQAQISLSAFLAAFFSAICIMVHGRRMTDLVQAAEFGDDDAFCLAVQVDKRVLSALPYFRERYEKAILRGETDFLEKLNYRLTSPLLRSKIRHKTLWLTFACLDDSGHLDGSLKHREILDICEEAGVGGCENRIEDVSNLSKRLREYRAYQKAHQMSRH